MNEGSRIYLNTKEVICYSSGWIQESRLEQKIATCIKRNRNWIYNKRDRIKFNNCVMFKIVFLSFSYLYFLNPTTTTITPRDKWKPIYGHDILRFQSFSPHFG